MNYMGKLELPLSTADGEPSTDGISVRPVLLQKGNTRLALYGLGNVKDQRMHFELRSNRMKMFMPADKDDWFNILLVHQNRYVFGFILCFCQANVLFVVSNMARKTTFPRGCLTTV